jgi:DNA-binding FrmR family transcriptional regulator
MLLKQTREDSLKRLNRIEGQVKGISRMVEEERYCIDIINQISAAKSALEKVGVIILKGHLKTCVKEAMKKSGKKETYLLEEIEKTLEKFI